MAGYPGALDAAVEKWLDGRRQGLLARSDALSARYRAGRPSGGSQGGGRRDGGIDLAAYVTARLPATFAVNRRVMAEISALRPGFAPRSLVDVGAGPGTAGWAALVQWPSVEAVEQLESTPAMAVLLRTLNGASGVAALVAAAVQEQALAQWSARPRDLVLASYVLAEMPLPAIPDAVAKLWAAAGQMLVLIEPGTPEGYKRILAARRRLLEQVAAILAPCTHSAACPLTGSDWCHFKERVQRSRAHMHAKGASVPFEDEPFSYLVVARDGPATPAARVLAPPLVNKVQVKMTVCSADGLAEIEVPARDKTAYKRAKKVAWGERWTAPDKSS